MWGHVRGVRAGGSATWRRVLTLTADLYAHPDPIRSLHQGQKVIMLWVRM